MASKSVQGSTAATQTELGGTATAAGVTLLLKFAIFKCPGAAICRKDSAADGPVMPTMQLVAFVRAGQEGLVGAGPAQLSAAQPAMTLESLLGSLPAKKLPNIQLSSDVP